MLKDGGVRVTEEFKEFDAFGCEFGDGPFWTEERDGFVEEFYALPLKVECKWVHSGVGRSTECKAKAFVEMFAFKAVRGSCGWDEGFLGLIIYPGPFLKGDDTCDIVVPIDEIFSG